MIIKQFLHPWISHASYLIGDHVSGVAALVDPVRDVDRYLETAWTLGLNIRHVFLTRLHPDFEAGHLALRDRSLAEIYLGAWARPDYGFVPLKNRDVLEFGTTRLEILETPGRSRESISIATYDLQKSDRHPTAVLTGDSLWDGDLGWPLPRASDGLSCRELASMLYASLHESILKLPDETRLFPGHVPALETVGERWTFLGEQRRVNYGLRASRESEFQKLACRERDEVWKYLTTESTLNRTERPADLKSPVHGLIGYTPDELLGMRPGSIRVVDVREPADYAGSHWTGSLNVSLGPCFTETAGALLQDDTPIVVVADPGFEEAAVVRLKGLGDVAGYLKGGIDAMEMHSRALSTLPRWTAAGLSTALAGPRPPTVIDVRPATHPATRKIRGARRMPLDTLSSRLDELPESGELVLCCEQDGVAAAAASYLESVGRRGISTLIGGLHAWSLLG